MIQIKTKFDIGDNGWYFTSSHRLIEGVIVEISGKYCKKKKDEILKGFTCWFNEVYYHIDNNSDKISEHQLFKTKEEAIKYLSRGGY